MKKIKLLSYKNLENKEPTYALAANIDLVVIKNNKDVSVLYGRCLHRGALLSDGYVDGDNIICGVHYWDYRYDTGISEYNNKEKLKKFNSWIDEENDAVYVDEDELMEWEKGNPQPYNRNEYLGLYADTTGSDDEPHNKYIQKLAKKGIKGIGKHGLSSAMGVPLNQLPKWDNIQIVTAQLATKPLLDDAEVCTELIIGPRAKKPLILKIPIFISDMSFGALSEEAKIALAKGAELAAPEFVRAKGECFLKNSKIIQNTFMN